MESEKAHSADASRTRDPDGRTSPKMLDQSSIQLQPLHLLPRRQIHHKALVPQPVGGSSLEAEGDLLNDFLGQYRHESGDPDRPVAPEDLERRAGPFARNEGGRGESRFVASFEDGEEL
jgi:hypothetical protein